METNSRSISRRERTSTYPNGVRDVWHPQVARPMFQLQALLSPPVARYWFEKAGKPDLLQIQQDRLIHNWRLGDGAVAYPRYEKVKADFEKEIQAFSKWLQAENLGEIQPNQCEVTYSNLIDFNESDRVHAEFSRLTPLWTDKITEQIPAQLEDITTSSRFVFLLNEKPVGRVYVQFQPVFRQSDNRPMIKLENGPRKTRRRIVVRRVGLSGYRTRSRSPNFCGRNFRRNAQGLGKSRWQAP